MNARPAAKLMYRFIGATFQRYTWAWQVFLFGTTFAFFWLFYIPFVGAYKANNAHRTYEAAMKK